MRKADINFWTDVTIGVAFALSAASGIIFLLPLSDDSALGIGFQTWSTAHTWSSLLAVGGVIAHLALHWKWVVQMTRRNIAARLQPAAATEQASPEGIGRRAFLRYAALGALVTGATVAGARLLAEDGSAAAEDATSSTGGGLAVSTSSSTRSSARFTVACRKGVAYCPYPGRCHSYRDRDGDGYCDLSIPS